MYSLFDSNIPFEVVLAVADTRNFSKKHQQILLLDAIFFEQWGPFKR